MTSNADPSSGAVNRRVDWLGAFASGTCAVHCGLAALVPSALAGLGLGALLGHEAEWGFTIVAVVLAAVALGVGWRKHRSASVGLLFGAGMIGLVSSRFLEEAGGHELGTAVGVLAGLVLVTGHVLSLRAARRGAASLR